MIQFHSAVADEFHCFQKLCLDLLSLLLIDYNIIKKGYGLDCTVLAWSIIYYILKVVKMSNSPKGLLFQIYDLSRVTIYNREMVFGCNFILWKPVLRYRTVNTLLSKTWSRMAIKSGIGHSYNLMIVLSSVK